MFTKPPLSGNITCCKDCTERKMGCHSTCEKYLNESKKRTELNEKIRKQNDMEADFMKVCKRRRRR